MKTLLLVDGSSYLYRAYHALPDLRTSSGEPTGALRGFISMLHVLRQQVDAEYIACVFDAKGKTFRDDLFSEYKANRTAMPDDLGRQIGPIHEAVGALGWPIIQIPGIEADDVIATLARRAGEQQFRTIVSTSDKDLAQLVNENVTLVNTMSNETLDIAGVQRKFGVPPARIVDYLTLIGDSVDNVPGVDKVGPKTAAKWLHEYGSLDGLVGNAASVKGAVGENLRKALPWLPTARELVTIRDDCDLGVELESIEALVVQPQDINKLRELYSRYEFKAWLREIDSAAVAKALNDGPGVADLLSAEQTRPEVDYEAILSFEQLEAWLTKIGSADLTSMDTETTSLDPIAAQLVGISLSVEALRAGYIPLAHRYAGAPKQLPLDDVLQQFRPWLESPHQRKLGHDMKYQMHAFANRGIKLAGIAHDTQLQSYVLEAHRNHDLDSLAERHLGRKTLTYVEVCGKGVNQLCFDEVAVDRATDYAGEDAEVTRALHDTLWARIEPDEKLRFIYEQIELPTAQVLFEMERTGVLIDRARLDAQSRELGARIAQLEATSHELAGQLFNLGSPKQIGEILFGKLTLPVLKKTASGTPSTDEEVLEKLAQDYPLPKLLLEHRGLSKLKSTYCDKLPLTADRDNRVHTSYGQAVAVTGRLSSSDPNLQNIPIRTPEGRRIREAFIAPPGHRILSADYSQIELRIMAHISGDAGLLEAFGKGEDIHRATASEVFAVPLSGVTSQQRSYIKVINFGLMYGMSAFGVASNLGIERDAAKLIIDRYFTRFPSVAKYMESTRALAKRQGYVETVFGRRLWLPEINSPNGPRRAGAERAAINAPMQGTAADLVKLAMIAVSKWINTEQLGTRLVMQVHDELVFEVPEDEIELATRRVPELMSRVADLRVPLLTEVGVGTNWDEAH
ncbi:MAG TPA: DNA polymerase I [Burkholderiaceae bacterium]|nr:DNA polymerase I [Burkholderiaceae bacterium]